MQYLLGCVFELFCWDEIVTPGSFEKIAASIASLSKAQAKRRIQRFKGNFKLDFTESYLNSLSVDRLRHILMAVMATKLKHS